MSKIITLTAGHSDTDPGACAHGYTEAELMLELRGLVAAQLELLGYIARTDGTGSYNAPLADALRLIDGSALAIELHMNAAAAAQANGVEVVALPRDKYRAQRIAAAVAAAIGARLRGDKGYIDQTATHRGRLGYVQAGGMILEVCFISNLDELCNYLEAKDTVAHAIAQAIDEVVRIGEQEPA